MFQNFSKNYIWCSLWSRLYFTLTLSPSDNSFIFFYVIVFVQNNMFPCTIGFQIIYFCSPYRTYPYLKNNSLSRWKNNLHPHSMEILLPCCYFSVIFLNTMFYIYIGEKCYDLFAIISQTDEWVTDWCF